MQEKKEGDSPFRLSITATDFYLYVRDKDFFVYVLGRKEEEKVGGGQEIILVNYLVKISVSILEIDFSAYVERKKEENNSCGSCITDTYFCVYISTNLLINTWPFPFFFFFPESFVFECLVSLVVW